ncbi:endonuclease/exonuclease/phosphatase family protein [Hyphomonas johnsonii]|uniref:Endonuclease/exonuclease/phosphatase n=1 Tax=Hyphomonas johnsonii MHS-2 TaxID=1280950 RepID=A0A059FLW5_9PROT|nr:endonuclease/exonuclease/phosphatase family protein [Hyphomonas johnsonii]KCZ91670.1 endonuclease/exonuclease/phosphatase [Hyphomonas johnsonii MHS-2]
MPDIRLATFNCENLMMRCDFRRAGIRNARQQLTDVDSPLVAEQVDTAFDVLSEDDRTLTARALAATGAEVCALQEVENLVTLTAFDRRYIAEWTGSPFDQRVLHEGNDSRGIDVALLSRLPVSFQRSHARKTFGRLGVRPPVGLTVNDYAFRRDCLEVDVVKDGRVLTLFVCHFKSMHGGRRKTRAVRQAEAAAVRRVVSLRFEAPEAADWVILGDFNDYCEVDGQRVSDCGLGPLLDDGFAVDLAPRAIADPLDRWTHHFTEEDTYGALDHMLVSPRLAAQNPAAGMEVIRAGSPYHAARYTGFRYPGIGWFEPKASDHCPLVASIKFEGQALNP